MLAKYVTEIMDYAFVQDSIHNILPVFLNIIIVMIIEYMDSVLMIVYSLLKQKCNNCIFIQDGKTF